MTEHDGVEKPNAERKATLDANPYESPETWANVAQSVAVEPTLVNLLFSFRGRIPRRVFWAVQLSTGVGFYALLLPITALFGESMPPGLLGICLLMMLVIAGWICIAATIKRWHDRNRNGWMALIVLVPVIGWFWMLIECGCMRGTVGPNRYGSDPTLDGAVPVRRH